MKEQLYKILKTGDTIRDLDEIIHKFDSGMFWCRCVATIGMKVQKGSIVRRPVEITKNDHITTLKRRKMFRKITV